MTDILEEIAVEVRSINEAATAVCDLICETSERQKEIQAKLALIFEYMDANFEAMDQRIQARLHQSVRRTKDPEVGHDRYQAQSRAV